MKVCICLVASLENNYITEFINYYRQLGFDNIFIYDNNDVDGERFEDVIGNEIESGYVTVFNKRGIIDPTHFVCNCYQEFYDSYGNSYDWIFFVYCDEYLVLNNANDIKEYLALLCFDNYDSIHINWQTYNDNNLVYYSNEPLNSRFTTPAELNTVVIKENVHIKSLIRGGLSINVISPHHIDNTISCCDNRGESIPNENKTELINYQNAYIKHFRTKTIDEYMNNKMEKLVKKGYDNILFDDVFFFNINTRTPEKEKIYYDNIFKYTLNYDNLQPLDTDVRYTVLTCCFGTDEYGTPYCPYEIDSPNENIDYICITDISTITSKTWNITVTDRFNEMSDIEKVKYVKFHPFEFTDNEYCIYVDSTIWIKDTFELDLLNPFFANGYDLGLMMHDKRNTVLKELKQWELTRDIEKYSVDNLTEFYKEQHFEDVGLFFLCIIMYKNTEATARICQNTYSMLKQFGDTDICRSDQVIFPYVVNTEYGDNIFNKVLMINPASLNSTAVLRVNNRKNKYKAQPNKFFLYRHKMVYPYCVTNLF